MNPDLEFARAFFADPSPRPIRTNALLEALGAHLIAHDREKREVVMRFIPGSLFRQGTGNIQGGAVAAMLDFAMVFAAFAGIDEASTVSTATMTTSFFAPAAADELTALGRVEKPGRRLIFAAAELRAGERIIAGATSTLLVLPRGQGSAT
jgi:uncharacterized protein (TIGR00369 family)